MLNCQYVSFNPHRSIGIPAVRYIKPESMYRFVREIHAAQTILFPEYWQVNTLIYGLKKQVFPSPATYHLGHDKIEMTRAVMACFPEYIPKTEIRSSENAHFEDLADEFGLPFVCKEVRNSSGFGVFLIHTKEEFTVYKQDNSIVYVQEYIEIDRDLRVVVIGDGVVDAYWRIKETGCFHCNLARGAGLSRDNIPGHIIDEVMRIALFLKVDYAGFDVVPTSNGFKMFEFNLYFGTKGVRLTSVEMGRQIHRYIEQQAAGTDFIAGQIRCGTVGQGQIPSLAAVP